MFPHPHIPPSPLLRYPLPTHRPPFQKTPSPSTPLQNQEFGFFISLDPIHQSESYKQIKLIKVSQSQTNPFFNFFNLRSK